MNGFMSLRRLNGQFHCSGRKNRFGLKLKEVKKTFFQKDIVVVQAGESNKGITG